MGCPGQHEYLKALLFLADQSYEPAKVFGRDFFYRQKTEDLMRMNQQLFQELKAESYLASYANPSYAVNLYGIDLGGLLSAIYADFRGMNQLLHLNEIQLLHSYWNYAKRLKEEIECNGLKPELIKASYVRFKKEILVQRVENFYQNHFTQDSKLQDLFQSMDWNDERSLFSYGKYISENELKLHHFMKAFPKKRLRALAETIVNCYIKGFTKDNKNINLRHNVRIGYQIGQERLVLEIIELLNKNSLLGIAGAADSTEPNKQYLYDHKFDHCFYLDKEYLELENEAQQRLAPKIQAQLRDYSGVIVLEKFGETPFVPENKSAMAALSEEQVRLSAQQRMNKRKFMEYFMPEQETSFCLVAFPMPEIGPQFAEIFEDTCKINSLRSEKYEKVQQIMIDALDQGRMIRVKGQNGNLTDIQVQLQPLPKPETQTNFFNCTADVNIPLGEIFTSPQLEGTTGLLHVKKAFLNDLVFIDLKLFFEEGYIRDYSCGNFVSDLENRKYIEENLLFPHKSLPLGEFAIGTNTLAYRMAKKYEIMDKLPVLIVEKMGPHFAIGDTCYSWAEDVQVFNGDGKEILARENSLSAKRKTDASQAYTNLHTDITLPYDEIGFIQVLTHKNGVIPVLEKGRFVLQGTEFLNQALDD